MRLFAIALLCARALTASASRTLKQVDSPSNILGTSSSNNRTKSVDSAGECDCSYNGLSNGIDVSVESRGCFYSPMQPHETPYHCYITTADACDKDLITTSSRYPGASLRTCDPLVEAMKAYNDIVPFKSVLEAISSRKDLAVYSLIVSTNTKFGDANGGFDWNADSPGTLIVPTNAAIERFTRFRLMDSNFTSAINSTSMADTLKTLIVDGTFGSPMSENANAGTFSATLRTKLPVENFNALTVSYADERFLAPYEDTRNWFTRTFDEIFHASHNEQISKRASSIASVRPMNLVIERTNIVDSGIVTRSWNNPKVAVESILFARDGQVLIVDEFIEPVLNTVQEYEILPIEEPVKT